MNTTDTSPTAFGPLSSDCPPRTTSFWRAASTRRWVTGVAVVLFVVLLQAATQYFTGRERTRVLAHIVFLAVELPALMGALFASSTWASKRQLRPWQTVLLGVVIAGLVGICFGVAFGLVRNRFPTLYGPLREHRLSQAAALGFTYAQLHFGIWTLGFVYPYAAEDARLRALEAERLRTAAELARLRSNLEPHFLLNTLNGIAGLVTEDPRRARQLIASLGNLLRESLRDDGELRSLRREIEWLKRYAEVIEARYAGALSFHWEIEERANDFLLPTLLLQPLVENAVKHGALRASKGGGHVTIRAHIDAEKLVCTIEDDGPGVAENPTRDGAFGLHAVRRRLELYSPGSVLQIEALPDEGTHCVLEIGVPLTTSERAA